MISGRFYWLLMSNCFLCHRDYIINASEFHYNKFEKTKVFNKFCVYGSFDYFYARFFLTGQTAISISLGMIFGNIQSTK